jgi:hypothetical protein
MRDGYRTSLVPGAARAVSIVSMSIELVAPAHRGRLRRRLADAASGHRALSPILGRDVPTRARQSG